MKFWIEAEKTYTREITYTQACEQSFYSGIRKSNLRRCKNQLLDCKLCHTAELADSWAVDQDNPSETDKWIAGTTLHCWHIVRFTIPPFVEAKADQVLVSTAPRKTEQTATLAFFRRVHGATKFQLIV